MEYFELFGLKPAFFLDEKALRRAYLSNSKRLHPDFFTQGSDEQQAEALKYASLNNEAYETLSDFDRRVQYILQHYKLMEELGTHSLPSSFLFEMMEINEEIAELGESPATEKVNALLAQIKTIQTELLEAVRPIMEAFNPENSIADQLQPVKIFFLKKRYLLRIIEKLSIFADA